MHEVEQRLKCDDKATSAQDLAARGDQLQDTARTPIDTANALASVEPVGSHVDPENKMNYKPSMVAPVAFVFPVQLLFVGELGEGIADCLYGS